MQNKGASDVVQALLAGKPLKRGNAHTDGTGYYLFDNHIFNEGPPTDALKVKERLMGKIHGDNMWFTFAGWVTQTTLRHLRACHPTLHQNLGIRRGKVYFRTREGIEVELDPNTWYCHTFIAQLLKEKKDACLSS